MRSDTHHVDNDGTMRQEGTPLDGSRPKAQAETLECRQKLNQHGPNVVCLRLAQKCLQDPKSEWTQSNKGRGKQTQGRTTG